MNRANRPRLSRISGSSYGSKLLGRAGDGSTLSLDFTTGVLDPRITFTRASGSGISGTGPSYIGSNGYVQYAGTNIPRFDYDPTTLQPRGLLVEGSATNVLTRSEALATSPWSAGSGSGGTVPTVTNNNDTAPDGNSTATRIELNITGGGFSRVQQVFTGTAGVAYTFSVWMKLKSGSTPVTVAIRIGADGTPGNTNRTVTSSWQRFQTTYTPSSTTVDAQIMLWTTLSTSTTADVLVWGAQLEAGSGASSYIPTGASTATRAADECQILDLTTMSFNANAGTIYVDMGARVSTGSNRSYTFLPASGGNNQLFEGSGTALNVYSGGAFVAQIGSSTNAAQRVAAAYAVNDYAVSVNGGAVSTDTSGALPSSLTKLTIGGSIINTAAYQFGCIRTFKYWPNRLPNAQLQSLTT